MALEAIYKKHGLPSKGYFKSNQQNKGISTTTSNLQQEVDEFPKMDDQEIQEVKDNSN